MADRLKQNTNQSSQNWIKGQKISGPFLTNLRAVLDTSMTMGSFGSWAVLVISRMWGCACVCLSVCLSVYVCLSLYVYRAWLGVWLWCQVLRPWTKRTTGRNHQVYSCLYIITSSIILCCL